MNMLVLARGCESDICIGSDIIIRILAIHERHVMLGIEAPRGVRIRRKEVAPAGTDCMSIDVNSSSKSQ
jgi:carbon storage regulator CsrA